MSKSKTLKELLECEFTINKNGKMVGEIPLERINEIADILTNEKERIDKAIEYIKTHTKIIPFNEMGEGGGLELTDYDIADLLKILGDKENE